MNSILGTQQSEWFARAAVAGAVCWFLYYVFDIAYGLAENFTNMHVENSPGLRFTGPAYFGGVVLVGIVLYGIYLRLQNQYKTLALPALLLTAAATLAATLGLSGAVLSLLGFPFPQQVLGYLGPSILPLFVSAILLSIASMKAQSLPASSRKLLLIFGLTHLPLGLGLWVALENVMPGYLYNELHFFISGFYWLSIAQDLRKEEVLQPTV